MTFFEYVICCIVVPVLLGVYAALLVRAAVFVLLFSIVLLLAGVCHAQPTAPLTIEPNGWARSGWSHEVLTYDVVHGDAVRRNRWRRATEQSPEWSASDEDYRNSGYDRFHHAPSGDFGDQDGRNATFNFANCSLGNHALNIGPWKALEASVRNEVTRKTTLHVDTGPLYLPDEDGTICLKTIGPHKVPVPTHYAKAVLQIREGRLSMAAWIMPNIEPAHDAMFENFKVTVNEVEFAAGKDLNAWLPDDVEEKLEAGK